MGFKWTSIVIGPFAALAVFLGIALSVFGLASGGGVTLPTLITGGVSFYLVCVLWGIILGGVIGLLVSLIRRPRPKPRPPAVPPPPIDFQADFSGEPAPNRLRWLWLWPWLAGLPILLLLTTALGAGFFLRSAVDRRLADAIAAADRDDPNWRLDDLMAHREPVPDDENSALVVAEVVSMLVENWPPRRPIDVSAAYARISRTQDNIRLDGETVNVLRAERDRYADGVGIARTVANFDRGRHELEITPAIIDTSPSESLCARRAAWLLATDAAIRAEDGDIDGALDSCRAILGVARSIGDEPFAMSQLVRVAIGNVAVATARRALGQGEPSDEALARLQADLLKELERPGGLRSAQAERAVIVETILRVGKGEIPVEAFNKGAAPLKPGHRREILAPWDKLYFDNARAITIEWMNRAVAIARRPDHEQDRLWKEWEADRDRFAASRTGLLTAMLALLLKPEFASYASSHLRHRAELGSLAILVAAERHRRKTGDWPPSIAAIDPAILPNPPLDPFSGRSYLIDRPDGKFVVHSIGRDGKDQHGAFDVLRWLDGGPDDVGSAAWDVDRRGQPLIGIK